MAMSGSTKAGIGTCVLASVCVASLISLAYFRGARMGDTARRYPYENGFSVIRTHEFGRQDRVFMQLSKKDESYITVQAYLKTISNQQDRAIEQAKIEKIVGTW